MVVSRFPALGIALLLAATALPPPGGADSAPVLLQDESSPAPEFGAQATTAACTLAPGPIQTSFSWHWTSPDAFTQLVWRIPRSACTACAANYGLEIKTVSFRLRWFGACSAAAEVSIVGGVGSSGCLVPDPTQVLYGPTSYPLVATPATGVVHTLTLPAGWCVGPDAFVMVHFMGLDTCYPAGVLSPGLTSSSAPCVNCTEYITTTTSFPTLTDWCSLATGAIWMQVEADCCGPVGVEPGPGRHATALTVLDAPSRRVRMRISLAERGPIDLSVYDITGRRVRTLLRGEIDSGDRSVEWDGTSNAGERLPAGVYKVRLRAGAARAMATAILLD